MDRKTLQRVIADLREIQRTATMERAEFRHINGPEIGSLPYPTSEDAVTPFIRERTQIWRDTWIVGMLGEVLNDLEKAIAATPHSASRTDHERRSAAGDPTP